MHEPKIASPANIHNLLKIMDSRAERERSMIESDYSEFYDKAGITYQSDGDMLTLLFMTDSEACYFQGGLVFFISTSDFKKLVRAQYTSKSNAISAKERGGRRLTGMEVEFVLGIISVVDPLAYWTVFGSDLLGFLGKNRKNLERWTVRIASLLLAQRLLKKYAGRLYRKVSQVLVDGVWSKLSETVSTDDASIARFAGYLLGYYGSDDLMERVIDTRWSIFHHILSMVDSVLDVSAGGGETNQTMLKARVNDLFRSFGKLGVYITIGEVVSMITEMEPHPHEIKEAIEIIKLPFLDG